MRHYLLRIQDEEYKELWIDFNTSTESINIIHTPYDDSKNWLRMVLHFNNIVTVNYSPSTSL